jgi:hypothetical protein
MAGGSGKVEHVTLICVQSLTQRDPTEMFRLSLDWTNDEHHDATRLTIGSL